MINSKRANIYTSWFPKNVREISIIVSEDPDGKKSRDSLTTAENYSYLDNVGDKDTLLEVVMLISRYYPNARIRRLFPREFNEREDLDKNLIVIGGPVNNPLAHSFMVKQGSKVSYDVEKWVVCIAEEKLESDYSPELGMKRDIGYFASFKNPYNSSSRVVLINGMNTFGTLGAFKAFSDLDEAGANHQFISELKELYPSGIPNFETYFYVDVHNCDSHDCTKVVVDCPIVLPRNVIQFESQAERQIQTKRTKNHRKVGEYSDVGIITVLKEETAAAIKVFELTEVENSITHRLFYEGNMRSASGNLHVVMTQQISQGQNSVISAYKAIMVEYKPKILFLLGIAGGISSDVDYCDVVIGNQIIGYDLSKDTPEGIVRRGEVFRVSAKILPVIQRFEQKLLVEPITAAQGSKFGEINVVFSNICSGSAVVANTLSEIVNWTKKYNDKTAAVEMEALGLSSAVYEDLISSENPLYGLCVVRGISDLANEKKRRVTKYRVPAAENAALIAKRLICMLPKNDFAT